MPTPDRAFRGQAVPLAAIIFDVSESCPIPAGYAGYWFDGTVIHQRNTDGSDSAVQHVDSETIGVAGGQAAHPSTRTTRFDLAAAGDNITSLLPAGTQIGQRKTLVNVSALAGKTTVVTPTPFADGATVTLTARFDGVELEWQLAGWRVVGLFGTASVA